MSSAILKFER